MTAGPTPVPPKVSQVMAEPILYHRAPAFVPVYARVLDRLKTVFDTSNDVLCFASSGSGAMESAMVNLVHPGDKIVVTSAGKFGERWKELADAYEADYTYVDVEWGTQIDPAEVDRALSDTPGAGVVFTTLSETSTGVIHDVAAIAEIAHKHGALIVVDAVSGLGAAELHQDAWGLDVVVSGSQKALMCPPGMGFASVSQAALDKAAERPAGRYYFDWNKTAKGQRKDPPSSPFTPPVSLFMGLDVALDMIVTEALPVVYDRHRLLGRATRAAVKAHGMEIFGLDDEAASVVTAVSVPEGVDGAAVPKLMRDKYGITIAGGQSQLKGKILRIAHCGYFGPFDIITTIAGLEMAINELGGSLELGAGVAAAQRVFADAGVTVGA
ncbi:MAG: alanine--glyoxylate aminotransferase family protein [Actinobacteria bacterium]|nr:alanine--glyoxylate aminotransferase family protein [Actinomycetota bacterium]